jgi:squalene-hopene/tetraprenyl-beta-curcumene cyclase
VLWGLGAAGIKRDEPWICRAISFLIDQQCDNGAWWGRWKACYLAETATILLGLSAVGEDMSAAYVARAVRWLASCQNSDGGFGELPAAYRNPLLAGKGPSMPPVTAYAVLGLIASGQAPASVIARAAAYLVATQRADGLWDNTGWLHTFIPPDLLYTYDFPAQALPLLALSEVRRSAACG